MACRRRQLFAKHFLAEHFRAGLTLTTYCGCLCEVYALCEYECIGVVQVTWQRRHWV